MRVLIVEDEALIAMYLERLVVEFGHEVCAAAACVQDAIERASTHRPDVALIDIRLAFESSGIDAARELHARYRLRCIFLSANLDEATRNAALPYEPICFHWKADSACSVTMRPRRGCACRGSNPDVLRFSPCVIVFRDFKTAA
jgi:two-component system, response regulator PdtaR